MPTGKGYLRIAIEDFAEGFKLGDRVKGWINAEMEKSKNGSLGNAWGTIINELNVNAQLPSFLKSGSAPAALGLAAVIPMLIGALIGLGFSFVSVLIQPIAMLAQYQVSRKWSAYRIDPRGLASLLKRFPEKNADWISQLLDLGVDEKSLNGLQALNIQYLTILDYVSLWRRGEISNTEFENILKRLNFLDVDIDRIKQVTQIIPPPSDLIQMSVREAFDDGFASRFGTDEGLPGEFVEWAKKQGLSEEWSKRYWRQHWQLPGVNNVFEMLHRLRPGKTNNTVTGEDVNAFLKAADYTPFWRERLKDISYAPYTRVDIRRMYKTGVLTEAQVHEAYLDIGYDEEHATALTNFTTLFEAEEETGIVKSSVLNAYKDGMIDRNTATTMLDDGGYDLVSIDFFLNSIDFEETLNINKIKLQNIKRKFIDGLIDETTVNNEINSLNMPAERTSALLALWITERENQVQLPTLTQIEKFYELGISTLDDYKRVLKLRGYADETINWNMRRMDIEKAEKAAKDVEKAQADSERLQKSKTSSKYQKDKAKIDLDISQAKAENTDIDIALHAELDDTKIAEMMTRKDEIKKFIATMNTQKAQLHFDTQKVLDDLAQ